MLALNKDKSLLIFSVGKTGSTSIQRVLDNSWLTLGEERPLYSEWITDSHIDDQQRYLTQYEMVDELAAIYNPQITCIIRDPWKRFVSGMKEVIQDYCFHLYKEDQFLENWNRIMDDDELCKDIINGLYYLSEFETNKTYQETVFDWHRSFAIFHNYHTKNWLHKVVGLPDSKIITVENLDDYITSLGFTPTRENVSNKRDIKTVESALKKSDVYHLIEKYLEPEIKLFKSIT